MEDVKTLGLMVVPRAGVEPARPFGQRILSPQQGTQHNSTCFHFVINAVLAAVKVSVSMV